MLAEPDPGDMVHAIGKAIHMLPNINPHVMHSRMKKLYSWHDVAKRTETVYNCALQSSDENLLQRLPRYLKCGAWAGKLFGLVMIVNFLLWRLLELWQPAESIEEVPDLVSVQNEHEEPMQDFVEARD